MTPTESDRPLLEISFEGPSIKDGRILLDDLLLFLGNIQSAVARIINVMETGRGIRTGRPPRDLQVLSALEVVAVSRGSFTMALDLRREQELLPEFDVGERAVESLTSGIVTIAAEPELPKGYDQGVLMALREASRIFDRGVNVVHLVPRTAPHAPSARFIPATRDQIITRLQRFEEAWAVVEGRLLMADVKEEALRCRLHPSAGDPIMCSFSEDMVPLVTRYLRGFVRAKGEATVETLTNKIRGLVIRDIEPIEEPVGAVATAEVPSSFWRAVAFDDLAAEQGVYPTDDLDKITGGWPEGADFESFLASIRSIRAG